MRQKSGTRKSHGEKVVKYIRRATRKQYSAEEKIRIGVLGTLSMGLATGLLNAGVASSGVWARRAIQAGNAASLLVVCGLLHVVAGGVVVLLCSTVLLQLF